MTHIPWFRETIKECKKQLRLSDVLDAIYCWQDGLIRAKRIMQKRKKRSYKDLFDY